MNTPVRGQCWWRRAAAALEKNKTRFWHYNSVVGDVRDLTPTHQASCSSLLGMRAPRKTKRFPANKLFNVRVVKSAAGHVVA